MELNSKEKKTECKIIITYNAEYWCEVENNYYKLLEIEDRDTTMKKERDNNNPIEKTIYKPPADHPWRKNMISRNSIRKSWNSGTNPEV